MKRKLKTFAEFQAEKGKQWFKKVSTGTKRSQDVDININIGLMFWSDKDSQLKQKRGKRIIVRVPRDIKYRLLLDKAEEKWKAYNPEVYDENGEYVLIYESGTIAMFLPGTSELFTLKRYQEELGKDYKRIVLFLCKQSDHGVNEICKYSDDIFDKDSDEPRREEEVHRKPAAVQENLNPNIDQNELF